MLQLARAYADRPAEEWKPLFYRILENRIRDMQRRRTVRARVIAWLPFRGDDEDEEPDPIAQAPSTDPAPVRNWRSTSDAGAEKALTECHGGSSSISAAYSRGTRCGRDGPRDGLLRR